MKLSYSDQLRDPRWQRKRLEIMQRADFKCETCGDETTTLNVHHKLYRKGAMPWEYSDAELACVCETCHEAEHQVRQGLAAAMAELDSIRLEELLGFAEGLIAKGAVMTDEPQSERRYPMRSPRHIRGFLEALWGCVYPDQIDMVRKENILGFADVERICVLGPDGVDAAARSRRDSR